jgi:UDP:flavonoid glycosyltransferase YjiC (YdhE family)
MRIYLAPCGIGLGHVTRTKSIAKKLLENGDEIIFSTYLDGLKYARAMGFNTVASHPILFKVAKDGTVDFRQTSARSGLTLGFHRYVLKQIVSEITNMKRFKPDLVFSDSRASSVIAARLLKIPIILMLNQFKIEIIRKPSKEKMSLLERLFFFIANIFWILIRTLIGGVWGQSDLILIPDFPKPNTISIENLAIPRKYLSKVRYVGPIVDLTPNDFQVTNDILEKLNLSKSKLKIYAAISGPKVERRHLTNQLLKILRDMPKELQFVLSCGDPGGNRNPTIKDNLIIYEWLDDETQYGLLRTADIIICRSGHGSITKALTFGKPLILIPTPDHTEQNLNAKRAVKLGVAVMLNQKTLTKRTLLNTITEISNNAQFKEKAEDFSNLAQNLNSIDTTVGLIAETISKRVTVSD